jgi:hypothetical protein
MVCCYYWERKKEGYLGEGLWDHFLNGLFTHGLWVLTDSPKVGSLGSISYVREGVEK